MKLLRGRAWGGGVAWLERPCPALPLLCPAVDHVVPEPECSLAEALERWREWADGKACCDYTLHVDIPRWSDRVRQELHTMVQEKGSLPAAPWPWPALSPGRGGHEVPVLLGARRVLHGCQQELCPAGHLVGRVVRAGILTYPAHLSFLCALPQASTPSWCTWPTRICTRCPTPR